MQFMLDFETLSTAKNSKIITMAAIKYDPFGEIVTLDEVPEELKLYRRIDISSMDNLPLHECQQTKNWWLRQSDAAVIEAFGDGDDRIPVKEAMEELAKFARFSTRFWSHGSIFDIVIAETVGEAVGVRMPWHFTKIRDTRTIYEVAGVDPKDFPKQVAHHALHDCHAQVQAMQTAVKKLGITPEMIGERAK